MKRISFDIGGEVALGGDNPIVIQTMCNTATQDVAASVEQCRQMHRAGAQLIRLTTQGMAEVEALKQIKATLRSEGIKTPLVADVHFSADVALAVARVADKVRINPGNFAKEHEVACSKFAELIDICREEGTAIRIGLNHGSLGERITNLYGNTPLAMKEAVMEWLRMCVEQGFYRVVVSLKASNTKVMVEAYRLLYKAMQDEFGAVFPMHLGVTEAGNGDEGRIKSAVGIGTLLREGIGDTIRVSLTENPVAEIAAAKYIVEACEAIEAEKAENEFHKIKVPANRPLKADNWEEFIIKAACLYGPDLLEGRIDGFSVKGSFVGGKLITGEQATYYKELLMQACRRRFTRPEYIACPGCGRTLYDLEAVFNEVKRRTAHLAGVRIAIMGCIVNGPGEMADADYGYVGEGRGKVTLYRGKTPVIRSIPQEEAIDRLLELIESDRTQ
jgi:1-hydroxy-2-methyl-2-(E)-butenyl 4-diphosphate synthase